MIKTWPLRFPAKENPNMEKALLDWPIGCSTTSKPCIGWSLESSRTWSKTAGKASLHKLFHSFTIRTKYEACKVLVLQAGKVISEEVRKKIGKVRSLKYQRPPNVFLRSTLQNGPHAWLRQTTKFHHQASFVNKILRIWLFLRGYSFQPYCLGNSFM